METGVYPYRSIPFDLETVVGKKYQYPSPAKTEDFTKINSIDLTDNSIDALASQFATSHPQLSGDDSHYVLKEGFLKDIEYSIGSILLAIEYNFAQAAPRVRIIGNSKRSKKVTLLDMAKFKRLVNAYLRRTKPGQKYSGHYEVLIITKDGPIIVPDVDIPNPNHKL